VLRGLLPASSPEIEARILKAGITFNLQRVTRVRHPRSLDVLQRLAQQIQRIAYEEEIA
jgi:hypothetical protein